MTIIEGLKKLSEDIAELAAVLEKEQTETVPAETPEREQPAKTCTYEEARAILAEKSRTGFRAEVKALLTAHGAKQLSDITDPAVYAAIVADAEKIGNG